MRILSALLLLSVLSLPAQASGSGLNQNGDPCGLEIQPQGPEGSPFVRIALVFRGNNLSFVNVNAREGGLERGIPGLFLWTDDHWKTRIGAEILPWGTYLSAWLELEGQGGALSGYRMRWEESRGYLFGTSVYDSGVEECKF